MPVTIKTNSGGGSVTLDAGTGSLDTTLTLPNTSGTILQSGTTVTVAQGGTGATSLTANAVLIGNGTSAITAVSPTTAGNVLFTTDGSTWTATQKITQGTSVSPTTSTIIDFTSIPSWVKRISMMFNAVAINGSSRPVVRLGTSGGIVSTGYSGTQYGVAATGGAFFNISNGFDLIDNGSAVSGMIFHGIITIDNISSNIWSASFVGGLSNGAVMEFMGASVNIGATLTSVRLTTQNGTVQFTGGTVNILYE